jgi:hypothetical protein
MTASCDPCDLLREAVAAERARCGSVKAAVAAVARAFGLKPRRVEAVWWGESTRFDWREAEQVRAAAAAQFQKEIADAEARAALLRARIDALGARLDAQTADVAGEGAFLARMPREGTR